MNKIRKAVNGMNEKLSKAMVIRQRKLVEGWDGRGER